MFQRHTGLQTPHPNSRPQMKFYENAFPADGEIVAVRVEEIHEYGVNVELLEYDLKGMVMANEVSRKRIRTVKEVLRIGQETAAQVTTMNKETGCVDLSIKLCTADEIAATLHQYHRHGAIYSILNRVAELTRTAVETHLAALVWPRLAEDADTDIYELFVTLNNPEVAPGTVIPSAYPHGRELLELVAAKLPRPTFTASAIVKLVCRDSLRAPELLTHALNSAAALPNVSVWIIAPPEYKFTVSGASQRDADEVLAAAIATARGVVGMPAARAETSSTE